MVTTRPPKTIVKPTALGPVANTDTKLLIYGLFQKGRVLAQDGRRAGAPARASRLRPGAAVSRFRASKILRLGLMAEAPEVRQSHTARVYGRDNRITEIRRGTNRGVRSAPRRSRTPPASHRASQRPHRSPSLDGWFQSGRRRSSGSG